MGVFLANSEERSMSIASCGLGHAPLDRALYSPREVQALLSISHATVYRLIAAGQLDARKLGSVTRITGESIGRLIAALPKVECAGAEAA